MKFRLKCEVLEQRENPADLPLVDPIFGIVRWNHMVPAVTPPVQVLPDVVWYPHNFVGPLPPNSEHLPPPDVIVPLQPIPPRPPSTGPIILPGAIFPRS